MDSRERGEPIGHATLPPGTSVPPDVPPLPPEPPTPGATLAAPGEAAAAPQELGPEQEAIKQQVLVVLQHVYDPEIPVNIYDLGLIYSIDVNTSNEVHVRMTLTSPMCPAAGSLPPEVEHVISSISGVNEVKVDVVWDPPWDKAMMTEAAKLQLNIS